MTREEKATIVDELAEKFSNNTNYYFADASGLSVAEINKFRGLCFKRGVEYKVYKNTLIKKALDKVEVDVEALGEVLSGTSGILFSAESSNAPAKIIKEFRKTDKEGTRPVLKGASIDSDLFIGNDHLTMLSNLKSKSELIGEVISLLQSPAKNVISALQSGPNTLAGLVKTLSER